MTVTTGRAAPARGWERLGLGHLDTRYARLANRLATEGRADAEVASRLTQAGWFDDSLDQGTRSHGDHQWLVTPTGKLTSALHDRTKPMAGHVPVVLVLTGALDPAHTGHVAALEAARAHLEAAGQPVAGGYLAPDHDHYTRGKRADALPAAVRVETARALVADHPWIDVDPWPALGAGTALNFTTIMDRLAGYLAFHLPRPVRVVAVYGADNAAFTDVLGNDGVCVARGQASTATAGLFSGSDESSTRLRAAGHLPPVAVRAAGRYGLRDDIAYALPHRYRGLVDPDRFTSRPRNLLATHTGLDVETRPVTGQPAPAHPRLPVLSLDPFSAGDVTVRMSRVFDCAAGQHTPARLAASPGHPPLGDQLAGLAGPVVLYDDDIASGYTTSRASVLLAEHGVQVVQTASGTRAGHAAEFVDVVDARDFLLGARDGGLVVTLPDGQLCRVPYTFPYVNLGARATMSAPAAADFSVALWQLNADTFTGTGLRVADTSPATRTWLHYLGFDDPTRLEQVAAWHLTRLTHLPCTPVGVNGAPTGRQGRRDCLARTHRHTKS